MAFKNASSVIQDMVAMHLFTDEGMCDEMSVLVPGSVDYVICEMKRIMLREQVIAEVKELWGKDADKVDSSRCPNCKTLYYYELDTSSNTCKQCGKSVFVVDNEHLSWNCKSR